LIVLLSECGNNDNFPEVSTDVTLRLSGKDNWLFVTFVMWYCPLELFCSWLLEGYFFLLKCFRNKIKVKADPSTAGEQRGVNLLLLIFSHFFAIPGHGVDKPMKK